MMDCVISSPKLIPARRSTKEEDPLKYDKRRNLSQGKRLVLMQAIALLHSDIDHGSIASRLHARRPLHHLVAQ